LIRLLLKAISLQNHDANFCVITLLQHAVNFISIKVNITQTIVIFESEPILGRLWIYQPIVYVPLNVITC